MYACGPTVYSYVHIGNLRTYIFEDILRRTLEISGYKVKHVMNITDVEDKIIRDAARAGMDIGTFVQPYEKSFFEDLVKLNIKPAHIYPRATEHIKEMIALIKKLLKKGFAYESEGSIYFDISKFKHYGRLSRVSGRLLKAGARVDSDEYTKDDAQDFVLWKAHKEGEPSWPAPFGEGRPGWHIECSAMSMKYLGATFDIHAGGVDLVFPHHENEIAQSEGATGKPFVKYFIEGEHLLVNGEKMSKSLGNVFTLKDIEAKRFHSLDFRYLALTVHYRAKMNFTWSSLKAVEKARRELLNFAAEVKGATKGQSRKKGPPFDTYKKKFTAALLDDLNAPKALGTLWQFVRAVRKAKAPNPKAAYVLLLWFDEILGLGLANATKEHSPPPKKVVALAQKREQLRREKRWQEADTLRERIAALGWSIEDREGGPFFKKI